MLRKVRFVLQPRWLPLHVLVLAVSVTMVLLGRWQLDVSNSKHFDLQNFGYSLQWWAFTAFALFVWYRVLRDSFRRGGKTMKQSFAEERAAALAAQANEQVEYRRYVPPTLSARSDDHVHSDYNAYLAQLAAADNDEPGAAK